MGALRLLSFTIVLACATPARAQAPEKVPWQQAVKLKTESIGEPVPVVLAEQIAVLPRPQGGHVLLLSHKQTRDANVTYFVSLDLRTGTVKHHGGMPGYQVWRQLAVGGKLYLAVNLPPHLLEYDPATDALRDLGLVYDKAQGTASMSLGPDGTLALGSLAGGEATVFDPATGKFRPYGKIGDGYIYSIGHDERVVLGADRGHRWDLVAVERSSGKRTVLRTTPHDGYIEVSGDRVRLRPDKDAAWEEYRFAENRLVRMDKPAPGRPHPPQPLVPEVLVDTDAAVLTGNVRVWHRYPGAKEEWRWTDIKVPPDLSVPIHRLVATDDGRIVGTTLSYGGMFTYDPGRDRFTLLGRFEPISVIGIAAWKNSVIVSGYPGGMFARADLSIPFTTPVSIPGRPGIAWTDAKANPHVGGQLGKDLDGAHETATMELAADGKLYFTGMRLRYRRGFGLGWLDPATNRHGKIDDNGRFDHLQVSWMCPLEGGKKLAISTRVQPDDVKQAVPPDRAKVFVYDVAAGKVVQELAPLEGSKALGPIAEVRDGLVGISVEDGPAPRTTIYRADVRTGKVLRTRLYDGMICGIPAKGDIPRLSHDFRTGPDGHVWTVYRLPYGNAPALIVRIDPNDLAVSLVGIVPGTIRMLFRDRDLYVTGAPHLRRIREIVPRR